MTKTVNILVGGPVNLWPDRLLETHKDDLWIGVDRGALRLLKAGIKPIAVVGDFDSLNEEERELVTTSVEEVHSAIPEKDSTDTELGLLVALKHYPEAEFVIYGATGGRLDHFMTNILMVLVPQFRQIAPQIRLVDRQNDFTFFLPGRYTINKIPSMKYLTFYSLTKMNLTLFDEKYKLDHYEVPYPISFSSNEFLGEQGSFEFDRGLMCVIQSKDE